MLLDLAAVASACNTNNFSLEASPKELAELVAKRQVPVFLQYAVRHLLAKYGHRGVREIDVGVPRWSEDPTQLFAYLQSMSRLPPEQNPAALFSQRYQEADEHLEKLCEYLRRSTWLPGVGWVKAKVLRFVAHRFRRLMGMREAPKFELLKILNIFRRALLFEGDKLVAAGILESRLDLFLLSLEQLHWLGQQPLQDNVKETVREMIAAGRARQHAEENRRQLPRVLLGNGEAVYSWADPNEAKDPNILSGVPVLIPDLQVSPGVCVGVVRVLTSPTEQLEPGEVMVCECTDPAWTPLFSVAKALVLRLGGSFLSRLTSSSLDRVAPTYSIGTLQHGAVVAREYGLPAVVGVEDAMTRLKTGDRVLVDGSQGTVRLLNDDEGDAVEQAPGERGILAKRLPPARFSLLHMLPLVFLAAPFVARWYLRKEIS